ncbi:MAG TPA: substrate-binding domain-containing protein [Candidatus Excrementavichristensenella intestinipullorum]|nr:substrate-binding domain-containing protein [Candidatus Excrementavichristensenella intestinipullorum]
MKKIISIALTLCVLMSGAAMAEAFDAANPITVVSREDGSGTRGAFIELVGVEQENDQGQDEDMTTEEAIITNSTSVMMTTVSGNQYAIGYVSLGSMNDSVKALSVDGVPATTQTVKDGTYAIARPFNITTMGEVSAAAQDFIDFILSAQGQQVIEDNGYIAAAEGAPFAGGAAEGKLIIAGSSSVTPVMEKLKEAYNALNAKVDIEIQLSDSTTGVNATVDGVCDIGMASRALKDSEIEKGVTATVIAMDGIAVIVNNANPLADIATQTVQDIYTGAVLNWSDVIA